MSPPPPLHVAERPGRGVPATVPTVERRSQPHREPRLLALTSMPMAVRESAGCVLVFTEAEAFDGIVLLDPGRAAEVAEIIRAGRHYLLPVLNFSGLPLPYADYQGQGPFWDQLPFALTTVQRILGGLQRLPAAVTSTQDPKTLLLARAYTRDNILEPTYQPSARELISYPSAGLIEECWVHAEALADEGLFRRRFFDRLHQCPTCGSSRLHVREECSACRSAELFEQPLIHHYRCAHQGLEQDFQADGKLVCPKCRRQLRHLGVDYDKPGTATGCRRCGQVEAEAAIAFVCLDCHAHSTNATIVTRDWHAYELTPEGERRLVAPDLAAGTSVTRVDPGQTFFFIVEQGCRLQARYGRPSMLLRVRLTRAAACREQHGERACIKAMAQIAEVLRGEVRDTDLIVEQNDEVLIYMPETADAVIDAPRRRLLERLRSTIRIDFGFEIDSVDPESLLTRVRQSA